MHSCSALLMFLIGLQLAHVDQKQIFLTCFLCDIWEIFRLAQPCIEVLLNFRCCLERYQCYARHKCDPKKREKYKMKLECKKEKLKERVSCGKFNEQNLCYHNFCNNCHIEINFVFTKEGNL